MSEQYLKQIDRLARQVEESHSALRRRNAVIEQQREEIKQLQLKSCAIEFHDAKSLDVWNTAYREGKLHGKRIATTSIITELESADSVCGDWAIEIIKANK
jgi:hypothetical protein